MAFHHRKRSPDQDSIWAQVLGKTVVFAIFLYCISSVFFIKLTLFSLLFLGYHKLHILILDSFRIGSLMDMLLRCILPQKYIMRGLMLPFPLQQDTCSPWVPTQPTPSVSRQIPTGLVFMADAKQEGSVDREQKIELFSFNFVKNLISKQIFPYDCEMLESSTIEPMKL